MKIMEVTLRYVGGRSDKVYKCIVGKREGEPFLLVNKWGRTGAKRMQSTEKNGTLLQVFDTMRKTVTAKYNKGYRFNEPVKCIVSEDSPHIKHKVEEAASYFVGLDPKVEFHIEDAEEGAMKHDPTLGPKKTSPRSTEIEMMKQKRREGALFSI